MAKLKILYLSPDFTNYGSAFYQQDVITTLQKYHALCLYGPGFPDYSPSDSIVDILKRCPFNPDIICIGHGWENQQLDEPFDLHPNLELKKCDLPKVMILNKEYKKLDEKLDYIVENEIDLVFTHHHNAEKWSQQTSVRFIHWPFAVNQHLFYDYGEEKHWDLSFTGVLKNPTLGVQSDLRIHIKRHIFYPVWKWKIKKPQYRQYRIYWGEWGKGTLPAEAYFRHMNVTKVCLTTLSPLDLVGTRYYEAMASKSLLFCERSSVYGSLFEDGKHCVMFETDLSDFDDKLFHYLTHDDERNAVIERAYQHVRAHHTWDKRVEQFTELVQNLLLK